MHCSLLFADLSISNLIALPGNVNSIMLSWKPLISPPLNYTIMVTRDDGYTEGIFVTKATALTVPLSQQLCGLYHISVATMCVTNTSISSGPKSSISIALGMVGVELMLQWSLSVCGPQLYVGHNCMWNIPNARGHILLIALLYMVNL